MATSSSAIFSGQSTFSSDFQQVLTRAVSIASLPLQSMQANVSTLTSQQQALEGLQTHFTSLQNTIEAVSTAVQGSFTAQSSQPLAASASVTTGAFPGTYSVEVDSPGSSSTTLSKAGLTPVSDPSTANISASSSFILSVNGTPHTITATGGNLTSLANAINASSAGVTATIVNVGANGSPDYRLALTSNNLAADTIQLSDPTNNLLDSLSTGAPATYRLNGGTTQLQSTSSEVTLAPGVTVRLLGATTSGVPATITVANDDSGLQSALSNLATAYNSAVDAVNQQHGTNAGPLAGQSSVYALFNVLEGISQYSTGSGTVGTLTALGLNLDQSGHLTFDPGAFSSDNTAAVQQFLGSTASGGFLKSANDALSSVDDLSTGLIASDSNSLGSQIANMNDQITQTQTRINDLQTNLQAQLSAADAAIATLQAQKTYFTNLFAATYLQNTNGSSG